MSDSTTRDDDRIEATGSEEPANAAGAWLPPRLREKLEGPADDAGDEWTPKAGSPLPAIITTAVVLIVAAGGFIWWRSASQPKPGEQATAQAESSAPGPHGAGSAAAPTDTLATSPATATTPPAGTGTTASSAPPASPPASVATGPGAASAGLASRSGSAGATAPTPATASRPSGTRSAAGASAASHSETRPGAAAPPERPTAGSGFGIVVASYLFEDRANSELERLRGATGLAGVVRPSSDGGSTRYDVVLGRFSSRSAAERKAAALVDSNLVRQAQVVTRSG